MIWIGDIPFFYQGLPNVTQINDLPEQGKSALKSLLNIGGVPEDYVSDLNITLEGKRIGLKSDIMGSRPVIKSHGVISLATSYLGEIEVANMWIKMGFIRLFDINHEDDIQFDIRNHLEEINEIAKYPLDLMIKDAQGKRDIFIVHGHDQKSRDQIVELLTKHKLRPRFLHEYSTGSETLVDLLEKAQECAYVIVVLTPDDFAINSGQYDKMVEKAHELNSSDWISELEPRGRQNVIFEFGFFRGLFGKERVCVLLKNHPSNKWDLPSDINGVYYSKYNETVFEKETEIINRLKRAGILI